MFGSELMDTIITQYNKAGKWLETRMKTQPDAANIGRGSQLVADVDSDNLTRDSFAEIKVVRVDGAIYHPAEVDDWSNITMIAICHESSFMSKFTAF